MAERSNFVKCARTLENLKTSDNISENYYLNGKYMLVSKNGDFVLLQEGDGLSTIKWIGYKGLPETSTKPNISQNAVILDAVMNHDNSSQTILFVINLPEVTKDNDKMFEQQLGGRFLPLRATLFSLSTEEADYAMQAKGLLHFRHTVLYCCFCGSSLEAKPCGTSKICTSCKQVQYPALSPVGITLIESRDHAKVLLVRQARHPKGMFSCVAGFVEPGESLEQNIQREVAEEVGIEVNQIEYISSQHWAMGPSQLMLGCIATAVTEDFEPDQHEIQDARWVPARELYDAVTSINIEPGKIWVPPKTAQAHTLMKAWLKKYHNFDANKL